MTKAERFFYDIKNKKIAFIGVGVSHTALIKMFLDKGISVTVCDKRNVSAITEAPMLSALGARFKTGENYLSEIDADIIFRTPGMYFGNPILTEYRSRGVVVTSEMEVFFDLCPCKIIAVTGSDGKTTTTTLIAEMLQAQGNKVFLGGNIGKALLPHIFEIEENDFAVVELSSFQLISMRSSPDIAVVTNVAPNHLDIHKTMEEYINAKKNIYAHQNAFSRAVFNNENEITKEMAKEARGEVLMFSLNRPVKYGTYLSENNDIFAVRGQMKSFVMNASEIKLPGRHNIDNYLTAITAVSGYVSNDTIRKIAREFGGVEHRIEFVRELDGVKYYNDSIASSPTRTIAGLKSFGRKICIIAGGYDKMIPYKPLGPYINKYVKVLVLIGKTAPKIEAAVREDDCFNANEIRILHAQSMEEAVELARRYTLPGDVISLSPASASFDLYKNFEERGRHFKKIVNELR